MLTAAMLQRPSPSQATRMLCSQRSESADSRPQNEHGGRGERTGTDGVEYCFVDTCCCQLLSHCSGPPTSKSPVRGPAVPLPPSAPPPSASGGRG